MAVKFSKSSEEVFVSGNDPKAPSEAYLASLGIKEADPQFQEKLDLLDGFMSELQEGFETALINARDEGFASGTSLVKRETRELFAHAEMTESENTQLSKDLRDAKGLASSLSKQVKSLQEDLRDLSSLLSEKESQLSERDLLIPGLRKEIVSLRDSLAQEHQYSQTLLRDFEESSKKPSTEQTLERQLAELDLSNEELADKLTECRTTIDDLRNAIATLTQKYTSLEEEHLRTQSLLSREQAAHTSTRADKTLLRSQLEAALRERDESLLSARQFKMVALAAGFVALSALAMIRF